MVQIRCNAVLMLSFKLFLLLRLLRLLLQSTPCCLLVSSRMLMILNGLFAASNYAMVFRDSFLFVYLPSIPSSWTSGWRKSVFGSGHPFIICIMGPNGEK